MHENILIDRIIGLRMFRLTEYGTRVSFKIQSAEQRCVTCCAAGDVAQEFIAHYCEGDVVAVSGIYKPRPSTTSSNTSWAGRFHVRALRGLGSVRAHSTDSLSAAAKRGSRKGGQVALFRVDHAMLSRGLRDADSVQTQAIGKPRYLPMTPFLLRDRIWLIIS